MNSQHSDLTKSFTFMNITGLKSLSTQELFTNSISIKIELQVFTNSALQLYDSRVSVIYDCVNLK